MAKLSRGASRLPDMYPPLVRLLCVVLFCALAGCTPTAGSSPSPVPAKAARAVAWQLVDATPVSYAVALDEHTVVYYAVKRRQLYLRAVDPASGTVRWEKRSALPEPHQVEPLVVEGAVVHLFPASRGRAALQFLAADGEVISAIPGIRGLSDPPWSCSSGARVCFAVKKGRRHTSYSARPSEPQPVKESTWGSNELTFERSAIHFTGGGQNWRLPYARFAPKNAWDGWFTWRIDDASRLTFFTVEFRPNSGPVMARDTLLLAIDRRGKIRWKRRGAVPCTPESPVTSPGYTTKGILAVCLPQGPISDGRGHDSRVSARFELAGINVRTGKLVWRRPAGKKASVESVTSIDGRQADVMVGDEYRSIDLVTGRVDANPTRLRWRAERRRVPLAKAHAYVVPSWVVEPVKDARAVDDLTVPLPEGLVARAGGTDVIALPGRLVGIRG